MPYTGEGSFETPLLAAINAINRLYGHTWLGTHNSTWTKTKRKFWKAKRFSDCCKNCYEKKVEVLDISSVFVKYKCCKCKHKELTGGMLWFICSFEYIGKK